MIIDWELSTEELSYMVKSFLPIGSLTLCSDTGIITKNPALQGCRFLKDRTGNIRRIGHSKNSLRFKNFPYKMLAYSFDQSLQIMMYDFPKLYERLTKLTSDIEQYAEQYITDCEHSAVLLGNNSLGKNLTLHTHRLTDVRKYTFTITVRLSFTDSGISFLFYEPISNSDANLPYYYPTPSLLNEYIKDKEEFIVPMNSRTSMLLFSASHIPHNVSFDNDLYLFYVYDNVTLKDGILEEIKNSSKCYFTDNIQGNHLFYRDLPDISL